MRELAIIFCFLLGLVVGFYSPAMCKNRPILSVAIVHCRRNSWLKWLTWQIPFLGDETWYFDAVERSVLNKSKEQK